MCLLNICYVTVTCQGLELSEKRADMLPLVAQVINLPEAKGKQAAAAMLSVIGFEPLSSGCSKSAKKGHHSVPIREGLPSRLCCGN